MATTTPNYGWTVPTSTDLVKDGATAIETLGDSVDATVKALNPSTTLGDIEYRSSTANTNTRLGIGTSGQVLTVAAGVPSWATASAGGMTVIASGSLTGAQVNLTSIPATYKNLRLVVRNYLPNDDGEVLCIRFQNDSNTRYRTFPTSTSPTSNQSFNVTYALLNVSQDSTTSENLSILDIDDYTNTTTWKFFRGIALANNQTTNTNLNFFTGSGVYNQTGAINEINLFNGAAGNFNTGTYILYGVS
jgi:hypothetical protein